MNVFVYINIDTSTISDYAKLLQSCPTLCDPMDSSLPGSSIHGASPGKYTRVGYHTLLQGIFLTQGSNLHLLFLFHWQAGSLPLASSGAPDYMKINLVWHLCGFFSDDSHLASLITGRINLLPNPKGVHDLIPRPVNMLGHVTKGTSGCRWCARLLIMWYWNKEIFLQCLRGLNAVTSGRKKSQREVWRCYTLYFEGGGSSHKPRNSGGL